MFNSLTGLTGLTGLKLPNKFDNFRPWFILDWQPLTMALTLRVNLQTHKVKWKRITNWQHHTPQYMTDSNFSPALLAIAFIFRLYPQIEDFPTYLSCFCKRPITWPYNFSINYCIPKDFTSLGAHFHIVVLRSSQLIAIYWFYLWPLDKSEIILNRVFRYYFDFLIFNNELVTNLCLSRSFFCPMPTQFLKWFQWKGSQFLSILSKHIAENNP